MGGKGGSNRWCFRGDTAGDGQRRLAGAGDNGGTVVMLALRTIANGVVGPVKVSDPVNLRNQEQHQHGGW